ncbi:uncharacterized protein VTP21DRAFT_11644 [Calcarisporiella thermophila]|uniref:uncharacterized protein n=1 Tax=Calcarisporiella thermophila TaxID=911321 RepID=UPI003744688D
MPTSKESTTISEDQKDTTILRRNRPGTKAEELYNWPHTTHDHLDSAFSLQEYLQSLIRHERADVDSQVTLPDGQTAEVWQYEHLRQLCLELTQFIALLAPECTKETCPEMRAVEWLYLCSAHTTPQNCCAIDYMVHTLDGATTLLNSNRYFPSRISIPDSSVKHFQSIARRLYRIFAHAYYRHREAFESFENETHLYTRFLRLSEVFNLVPKSLIIIPQQSPGNTVAVDT